MKNTKKSSIKIIGLTGIYCSGKNYVAQLLEQRSIPVLDVDKLGHVAIEKEKERIFELFGDKILGNDGLIDRRRLGNTVFGKKRALAALEEIIHPVVNQETLTWINSRKENACVINAALLHRSSAFETLDAVIVVEAPFIVRLFRARTRDHLPWGALIRRFRSQNKFNSQYFKEETDIYRVSNPSSCANSGYFGVRNRSLRKKLENRIDEILSLQGIT